MQTRFIEIRFRLVALNANSFVEIRFRLLALVHILIPTLISCYILQNCFKQIKQWGRFFLKQMEMVASPPENIPTPPENIPIPPAERLVESLPDLPERPDTPLEMVDPSLLMIGAHVEVTSRLPTPPLITRCDKSTQTNSPRLELGKSFLERPKLLPNKRLAIQPETPVQQPPTIVLLVPNHHSVLKLGTRRFIIKQNPVNNVNK
ncbi:hypothetical protein TNCT_286771 [Trichonephila clavata]|uniref:Uncharacterized protein n=1 Tax=Trichonephila clavata TaxID=2740835 RepID=A0A8X6F1W1_TRICU|nr:hypothetical protein TNCT_286771 [Trichonephila clavata]